jgi:hypothetical protein
MNSGSGQGDTFVIDVADRLNDTSMDVATSIVSVSGLDYSELLLIPTFSIGTVLTSIAQTLPTVLPS